MTERKIKMSVRLPVEIDFQPDDGPLQTLYADLSRTEIEAIERDMADPDAPGIIRYIDSRVHKDGPTHPWMFRVSRLKAIRITP